MKNSSDKESDQVLADQAALPASPVAFVLTPFPARGARVVGWLAFIMLVFRLLKKAGGAELAPVITLVSGVLLLTSAVICYFISGRLVFDPARKQVFYELKMPGLKKQSTVATFSQIHGLGVESKTWFINSKTGLQQAFDNSTSRSSSFRLIAITSSGKILRLSDYQSGACSQINHQAQKAAKLVGCHFVEGSENTMLRPQKLADGRYRFASEDFDPTARQNIIVITIIAIMATVALIAKATGN
jgi:hypothetical protein